MHCKSNVVAEIIELVVRKALLCSDGTNAFVSHSYLDAPIDAFTIPLFSTCATIV